MWDVPSWGGRTAFTSLIVTWIGFLQYLQKLTLKKVDLFLSLSLRYLRAALFLSFDFSNWLNFNFSSSVGISSNTRLLRVPQGHPDGKTLSLQLVDESLFKSNYIVYL